MRKLFWCCTAVGVLMTGGAYLGWRHACAHPDSVAGRALVTASGLAIFLNPLAGVGPLVEQAVHSWRHGGSEESIEMAPGDEAALHEEPMPVPREVEEGEAGEALPRLEMAGMLERAGADAAPAPIVIPEEEPPAAADEGVHVTAATMDMPEAEVPGFMPYCDDGIRNGPAPAEMPYVEEGQDAGAAHARPCCGHCGFMKAVLHHLLGVPEEAPAAAAEADRTKGDADEAKEEAPCPYHHHQPICPSNYCPYTGRCYPEQPAAKPAGGEEGSEETKTSPKKHPKRHHHKVQGDDEPCPMHPCLDTMEYRKSDAGLNEYGPGGPF